MARLGPFTAFVGKLRVASGSLADVAPAVKAAFDADATHLLVFEDATGHTAELDLRGELADVLARLAAQEAPEPAKPTSRGRPKLGVIAREVTLLPRHWEWLAAQPGGASAALRRLVEDARRAAPADSRQAQEAVHRVMFALAGDLPDFEEASRAFYAKDYARFDDLTASWPQDVGDYVRTLVRRVGVAGDQR
ncbi:DUF2239 family protein [Phenylobacterium sp.]|uniref:DUF2239 family protein n=1 Tax=Phenylobacterium sp. TaxID=1871053 RepID=UPI002736FDA4|nr:DUF2239 family protein [Phenylobacterium sp.]MDP3854399.1 DUF2239 family protein [Phenylobacterium sp.]